MARAKQRVEVFVVRKHLWMYNDEYDDLEGSEPVRTFRDRARAEEHRQELERRARRGEFGCADFNPFNMAGYELDDQTSRTEDELAEAVEALGLEPPDDGEWFTWWADHAEDFTPEQREALWALFDAIAFFEVVADEVEVRS